MPIELSEELAEFIESGVSMLIGTRDAELRPEVMRAAGAQVSADRKCLSVFLTRVVAQRTLDNLRDNGAISVTFSRPCDYRSMQLKGRVLDIRDSTAADHQLQDRWLAGFVEQVYIVGLPRNVMRQLRIHPSVAVTLQIEEAFVQTPGPGAGRRLERGERA